MNYTSYIIPAGQNDRSIDPLTLHFKKYEVFIETIFTESCRMKLPDGYTEANQPTNKISGISWGNHLQNSFRKGFCYWPSKDQFEIKAFYHNNGKFFYPSTGVFFDINEVATTRFFPDYKGNKIAFDVFKGGKQERFWYDFDFPFFKGGYWLYPYVNTPQDHDMEFLYMTNR